MEESEIKFAAVTTSQKRPGRKLTKSIFRQFVKLDAWVIKDYKYEIIGWVNYWWKENPYDSINDPNYFHAIVKIEGKLYRTIVDRDYRGYKETSLQFKFFRKICIETEEAGQVFLGDFCF